MMIRTRHRRPPLLVLGVIATVALVACGDDDASSQNGTDGATPTEATDADATTAEIVIEGFAFSGPGTVEVGTTVVVRNDDSAQHTWTSVDDVFDSGVMGADDTFSFTFDEAGEYAYFCEFHPSMTGTIVVTD